MSIYYIPGSYPYANTIKITSISTAPLHGFTEWDGVTPICNNKEVTIYKFIPEDIFSLPPVVTNLFKGATNTSFEYMKDWDTSKVTDMTELFLDCANLTDVDFTNWDTSNVTTMNSMFKNCSSMDGVHIGHLDTSNVTNMTDMFYGCSSLKDFEWRGVDTSNVTSFNRTFAGCSSLRYVELRYIDTRSVQTFANMFQNCTSLECLDLNNLTLKYGTSLNEMFSGCTNLAHLLMDDNKSWVTSGATGINMFYDCVKLPNFSASSTGINKAHARDNGYFGRHAKVWIIPGSMIQRPFGVPEIPVITNEPQEWDPWIPTEGDPYYDAPLKNTSVYVKLYNDTFILPRDCSYLFYECSNITFNDLDKWDFWEVENMSHMFDSSMVMAPGSSYTSWWSPYDASERANDDDFDLTELDIGTTFVTDMSYMFRDCWDNAGARQDIDLTSMHTEACRDMSYMFYDSNSSYEPIHKLQHLDVSTWSTENVEDMSYMFAGQQLDQADSEGYSLDLSNWDTSSVTDMTAMFKESKIVNVNTSTWNTSNVTSMQQMFFSCENVTDLDVRNFDTGNANVEQMFERCYNLESVTIGEFDLSSTYNIEDLFGYDSKLQHIYAAPGTDWSNYTHFTDYERIFEECWLLPNYNEFEIALEHANNMFPGAYFENIPKIWRPYEIFLKSDSEWERVTPYSRDHDYERWFEMEVFF